MFKVKKNDDVSDVVLVFLSQTEYVSYLFPVFLLLAIK